VLRLQARTTTSGQTYFFINILYSTGSPLQQQSWMTVTDTVWSVPPKNIYSLALYRERLLTPTTKLPWCFSQPHKILSRILCLHVPLFS
jgi:hypothetical protein